MSNLLIAYGSSIKSLEKKGDLVTVGAHGVLWGSENQRDLTGDWFTRDTYFGASKGLNLDTMLHHGIPLGSNLKAYADILLPPTVRAEDDEHGKLIATVLDLRNSYHKAIFEMCEEDALSWSGGANRRAVRRRDGAKCGEILQFPWMEFSFTPTPAEPRLAGISELDDLKSVPLDWLKMPNYAKAVRVLTNLKTGRDDIDDSPVEGATKSIFSMTDTGPYLVAQIAREAVDRLVYCVLYDALRSDTEPQKIGLSTLTPPTQAERLAYLKTMLGEFADYLYKAAELVLNMQSEESPDEAAKALRNDFLNLKAARRDGIALSDESEAALAAVEGFHARITDLLEDRASRKSGRVISQLNRDRLTAHTTSLQGLCADLEQLLGNDAGQNETDAGNGDAAKSLDAQLTEMELKFREFEAAANGVLAVEPAAS
jgi:hypothetical protein